MQDITFKEVFNAYWHFLDIWTTYKMIYNNDPAEVQEYA